MKWKEFSILLSGLNPDTPLGTIVAIRSETDSEVIRKMTPEQKRIRNEWRRRSAKKMTKADIKKMYEGLELGFKEMFNG